MLSDDYKYTVKVHLYYPNLAIDDGGNQGFWTMTYNEVCTCKHISFKSFKVLLYLHTQF